MDLTGKIVRIATNFLTNKFELTITVNEPERLTDGYEELKNIELLDIRIKKHRRRRSLDANAYFHVLVDKLADKQRISKPRCKNIMIGRYGQPYFLDDNETEEAVIKTNIPPEKMLEYEAIHCFPCGFKMENGKEITFYKMFRGSSTYDTKEMSILIDGTIAECKDAGIETLPPDELRRMLASWKA